MVREVPRDGNAESSDQDEVGPHLELLKLPRLLLLEGKRLVEVVPTARHAARHCRHTAGDGVGHGLRAGRRKAASLQLPLRWSRSRWVVRG